MARVSNPQEMRQRIVVAAIDVFARLGFHRATTDAVAAAAGLAKGTLYLYFRSKEEILIDGFQHYAEVILGRAEREAEAAGPDTAARVLTLIRSSLQGIQELRAGYPLYVEFMSLASHPRLGRQVRVILQEVYERFQRRVRRWLEEGMAQGQIAADTDVAALSSLLGALFDGYCMQRHFHPQTPGVPQMVASLGRLLDGAGLRPPTKPQRRRRGAGTGKS